MPLLAPFPLSSGAAPLSAPRPRLESVVPRQRPGEYESRDRAGPEAGVTPDPVLGRSAAGQVDQPERELVAALA